MADAHLGLGSNLGDRAALLGAALAGLSRLGRLVAVSAVYETAPWGETDQPDFLNLACTLRTELGPRALLARAKDIERRLGRVPSRRWGPRAIDIDLLLYGDARLDDPDLTLPHPRLTERPFALVPLAEIAPGVVVPGLGRSIRDLALARPDRSAVRRVARPPYATPSDGPDTDRS